MKRKWQVLIPFLLLVIALGTAILDWPRFYALLIDPLARIFWWVLRLFLIVDQEVYWILLIFCAFILAILLIPARQERSFPKSHSNHSSSEDRVADWHNLIVSAAADPDSRQVLQARLENLQKAVDSLSESEDPRKSVFRQQALGPQTVRRSRFRWIAQKTKPSDPKLLHEVDQVLTSLETTLEIKNGRTNPTHDGH